jgi:hypothetical protein
MMGRIAGTYQQTSAAGKTVNAYKRKRQRSFRFQLRIEEINDFIEF